MAEKGVKQIWHTALKTANDVSDKEGVGVIRIEGDSIYQYVRADTTGVTQGNLITISESHVVSKSVVTNRAARMVKGVAMATLTSNYYGWVLRAGVAPVTKRTVKPFTKAQLNLRATTTAGLLGSGAATTDSTFLSGLAVLTAATTAESTVSCMVAWL